MSAGSKAAADVATLLRSRSALLWVVSREEARVERLLVEAAQSAQYDLRFWDCATGVSGFDGLAVGPGASATDPIAALTAVRESRERSVWVFRDLPAWLRDPTVLRAVRSLANSLGRAPRDEARALIVLSPSGDVPPELAGDAVVIEWPLPDREEIALIMDVAVAKLPTEELRISAAPNGNRDAAIDAAVGLTEVEVQGCYARSLVATKRIDPAAVAGEKKRVIARERVMEWYDPLPGGLDSVGGLDLLKAWLIERRTAFGPRARAYGLATPKGILLVGVQGCGKSLTAKAIATAWQMPLLRLDVKALESKWVGESGANVRKAFRVAEAVAPCVLWLDEVEKAVAGATQGAADGGVSSDALGTFLTWMQEKTAPVFVVATANDVSALPPELLRKGRFDEMFFVDLPNVDEREAILAAEMRNRKIGSDVDQRAVAAATEGFIGAEVASLVTDSMFTAFADGERPVSTGDLISAAKSLTPLSKTATEKIETLRRWSKGRCRPATSAVVVDRGGRGELDV
jgi:hypothetical protein